MTNDIMAHPTKFIEPRPVPQPSSSQSHNRMAENTEKSGSVQPSKNPVNVQFFKVGELTRHLEATTWLIDDYIEANTLTLCFAPPESFKSFLAWQLAHDTDTISYPLYLSGGAGDFSNVKQVGDLIRTIQILCQNGNKPSLIVIDTLARNFGHGNENDAQAMNLFIRHVDIVRHILKCTVLIIHHTGHATTERGRGSSALRAAVYSRKPARRY